MALPPTTPELLARANAARAEAQATRKDIQDRLNSGALKVEYVLDRVDTNKAIGRWHLKVMLESLPGIGHAKAAQIMHDIGADPDKRLKGLGSNQKQALREMFP